MFFFLFVLLRDEDPGADAKAVSEANTSESGIRAKRELEGRTRNNVTRASYPAIPIKKNMQMFFFLFVLLRDEDPGADAKAVSEANTSESGIRAKRELEGRTRNNVTRASYPAIPIKKNMQMFFFLEPFICVGVRE